MRSPVVVIGAGPIGLAAAFDLAYRFDLLLEAEHKMPAMINLQ